MRDRKELASHAEGRRRMKKAGEESELCGAALGNQQREGMKALL